MQIGAGGVLLAALLFMCLRTEVAPRRVHTPLADCLPRIIPGWTITDEPLAATEEGVDLVHRTLEYDEFIYRRYRQGSKDFDVYVAYWAPAKVPTSMVAGHTPDICWIGAGWRKEEASSGITVPLSGGHSRRGEGRRYSTPVGQIRYVWYWHIGGREEYGDYGRSASGWEYIKQRLRNLRTDFGTGVQEQYFIRITSEQPLESWLADETFRALLNDLGRTALQETKLKP